MALSGEAKRLANIARQMRYREKHRKLGICDYCPKPRWEHRKTCYECTMAARRRTQKPGPAREKRLARLKLRRRSKVKLKTVVKKEKMYKNRRSSIWDTAI